MLHQLCISNYALIDRMEIDFRKGLTIITGETGAGKSILLDALSLLTGQRADTSVLQDKQRKCVVEATFDTAGAWYELFFKENDIDPAELSVVRREINPGGGSRAFINDTPVTLPLMKKLGGQIIDIHSQHQNLNLSDLTFQVQVLDTFADTLKDVDFYKQQLKIFQELQEEKHRLKAELDALEKEQDYNRYLFDELEKLDPKEDEQEELESLQTQLEHADQTAETLVACVRLLTDAEPGTIGLLTEMKQKLSATLRFNPSLNPIFERVQQALVEAKDLASECEILAEKSAGNPAQLARVNERLGEIYRLQKKHRVQNMSALKALKDEFEKKILTLDGAGTSLSKLENEITNKQAALHKLGEALHEKRASASRGFEKQIADCLKDLGLEKSRFSLEIKLGNSFYTHGMDEISFLFSANPGMPMQEISRVASGGELSRLMLAIKNILSAKANIPTLILDEIDNGISGETAARMGKMMESMSSNAQLIAITHLPQIASKGQAHLKVYKTDADGKTNSAINYLEKEERVKEIAGMLSAGKPGDAALRNALELLDLDGHTS
jgi:DNA repair protein RecN (Recombination protein N)